MKKIFLSFLILVFTITLAAQDNSYAEGDEPESEPRRRRFRQNQNQGQQGLRNKQGKRGRFAQMRKRGKKGNNFRLKAFAISEKDYRILFFNVMPDRMAMRDRIKKAKQEWKNSKDKEAKKPEINFKDIPLVGTLSLDGETFFVRNLKMERDEGKETKGIKSINGDILDIKLPHPGEMQKLSREEKKKKHEELAAKVKEAKAAGNIALYTDTKSLKNPKGKDRKVGVVRGHIKLANTTFQVYGLAPGGQGKGRAGQGGRKFNRPNRQGNQRNFGRPQGQGGFDRRRSRGRQRGGYDNNEGDGFRRFPRRNRYNDAYGQRDAEQYDEPDNGYADEEEGDN
ncbi:hypothetical protein ACFL35_11985 [Candidatus Riflebacteria bacterium]